MAVVEKSQLFAVRCTDDEPHSREYAQFAVVAPPIGTGLAELAMGQTGVEIEALGEVRRVSGSQVETGAAFMLRYSTEIPSGQDADDAAAHQLFGTALTQLGQASEIVRNTGSQNGGNPDLAAQWALGGQAKAVTPASIETLGA
jgi:hypothetical protein